MIPTSFDYIRPGSIEEAIGHLQLHGAEAKLLAGGHSLIPAMKLRLAQPRTVIDLAGIEGLNGIRLEANILTLGAMTTHYQIEASELVAEKCPLLAQVAPLIGDVQVRNRGTIGGSLVHADPAADWPAPILALEADLEIASSPSHRMVPASEFFVDMMQTAVQPGEILISIHVPTTAPTVAYVKTAQKASGFAIAGVAVVLDRASKLACVGVTGVSAKPYRAKAVERALQGRDWTPEVIATAAAKAAQGVDPLNDIHASAEFRAHLAQVNTRRALEQASARA